MYTFLKHSSGSLLGEDTLLIVAEGKSFLLFSKFIVDLNIIDFVSGSITKEIGHIGYLIGNKYDFYGDQQSALQYHTEYYNHCKETGDDIGLGKACQALAVANKR